MEEFVPVTPSRREAVIDGIYGSVIVLVLAAMCLDTWWMQRRPGCNERTSFSLWVWRIETMQGNHCLLLTHYLVEWNGASVKNRRVPSVLTTNVDSAVLEQVTKAASSDATGVNPIRLASSFWRRLSCETAGSRLGVASRERWLKTREENLQFDA